MRANRKLWATAAICLSVVAGVTGCGKGDKDGESTTLYVARDSAKPYILRVVTTGGDDPGTVTLKDYDKPVTVEAPPADQVMDMEQLMKEALKG